MHGMMPMLLRLLSRRQPAQPISTHLPIRLSLPARERSGLEILDDLPDIDTILVAIGGGGLISGLATAVAARRPEVRIIGIEPTGSPTLKASLDAGRCVKLPNVTTKVPTMACRETDPRIFEIVRSHRAGDHSCQ